MKLAPICGRFTLIGLLLAVAACGDGGDGSSASNVGTLAYVVTSCRETAGQATLQQELRIYHGTGETVTAKSVGPLGPFTSYGLCGGLGRDRPSLAPQLGAFQHIGVTPDGTGVVFELTDEFALVGRDLLPQAQRGRYYVRADGSGLRPLGPARRLPAYLLNAGQLDTYFFFDPSGRQFVYTDLGFVPETGEEAPQIFVQDLASGERRQLTRLPRVAYAGEALQMWGPIFADARTVTFARLAERPDRQYTILAVDTVDLSVSDVATAASGDGTLIPLFQIIGAQWFAFGFNVSGEAVNPVKGWSRSEVFVADGTNMLQLTNFGRTDTAIWTPYFSPREQRVYFTASADPLGTNSKHDCQIFSMDPLSRDMRQMTFFHEGGDHRAACIGGRRPDGCRIDLPPWGAQQPETGTLYFKSQCDPLGLNPNGTQLFAIQPDGTGLRQLTNTRGFVQGADRTVEVETVDFLFSYNQKL